jgi:hypothetical protein
VQIHRLHDLLLLFDDLLMKIFDTIHHGLEARDLVQNCIQLLLALGDDIDNALIFELDSRAIGFGESGVWSFKDWNSHSGACEDVL